MVNLCFVRPTVAKNCLLEFESSVPVPKCPDTVLTLLHQSDGAEMRSFLTLVQEL